MTSRPPVRILAESVARKIAAGEVIDRPSAVARELLDNSLDAESTTIDLHLEAGGNDSIRVIDNGHGMPPDDLERCVLPHATSKIVTADDLLTTRTLGFRGEALSSIAAVSRLEIVSAIEGEPAHRIRVHAGSVLAVEQSAGQRGTTVTVGSLFYNLPARKQFLKRAQTEGTRCKSVFLDKALPFPHLEFRLFADSDLKLYLPASSIEERIAAAYPERTEPATIHGIDGSGDGFSVKIVAGEPTVPRKDRRQLQVFVNRRRVWEYALVQAVQYAYSDYLHGGLYPVTYVFLEVDPELVDFNVHPAKSEVRFRDLSEIHRRIVTMLGGFLRSFDRRGAPRHHSTAEVDAIAPSLPPSDGLSTSGRGWTGQWQGGGQGPARSEGRSRVRPAASFDLSRSLQVADSPVIGPGFRYLGQIMGLFLVVERDSSLYLVDQHAAHERVIYDRLRTSSDRQELLFPIEMELEKPEEVVLSENASLIDSLGIGLEKGEDGRWSLVAVPSVVEIDAADLVELIQELVNRPKDFERELYASMSCRGAVMDGDFVSDAGAIEIISAVLNMQNARCPHGRPIWAEFSREALFRLVGRA